MANIRQSHTATAGLQAALCKPLILASASPRRQDILRDAGLDFIVEVSDAEADTDCLQDAPSHRAPGGAAAVSFALNAARAKALDISGRNPGRLVVAADTVVAVGDELLGKPDGPADAARMLRTLSGRDSSVTTAIAIACADAHSPTVLLEDHETSTVTFKELTQQQIDDYVGTGEPLDKAGAYALQGLGAALIAGVAGSRLNVIGLPMARLRTMLQQLGYATPPHHNN